LFSGTACVTVERFGGMSVGEASGKQGAGDSRTDQELVALVNGGDPDAFEALYLRYRDWVVNLAHRFTGSEDLALDVLQETFLYLLRKFPGFKLTANLKTFLYPAVKNLSIAAARKARRYEGGEEGQAYLEAIPSAQTPPSELGDWQIVLNVLSEEQREVLLLRFIDGLSLGEIAAAMDVPVGTVKSRLHNALRILRQDPRTRGLFE
jgi:RNA polymerase sigma-70 factor, ECF subfamily